MIIDLKVLNSQLDERFCWSEFNEMSIFSLLCICISRNISKKKINFFRVVNCDFHQHKGVSEEKSIPARAWRLNEKEKAQALKRCGFKSEDPFFMVVMQRSNLQNKCALVSLSLFFSFCVN